MSSEPRATLLLQPSPGGASIPTCAPLPLLAAVPGLPPSRTKRKGPQPSPTQAPERCPHCDSNKIKRTGTRKKKLETVSVYRCQFCSRHFTPGTRVIRDKTYSQQTIIEAVSLFNQHHTLENTAKRLTRRNGKGPDVSTISRWVNEYAHLTSYHAVRPQLCGRFATTNVMRRRKLPHAQVYTFIAHRPKLQALREGTLGGPPRNLRRFIPLADFLDTAPDRCPHKLFQQPDGNRGSSLAPGFIDQNKLVIAQTDNAATAMAGLVIPTVGRNIQRHEKLQQFMLLNDRSTLAVEVPVWLTEDDIAALEAEHHITLVPKIPLHPDKPDGPYKPRHLTGHIDFLQLRHDNVHILDYKPESRREKPFAQLTFYALALTRLVPGLRLFDIRCAWFDQFQYNEFYPRTVLATPPATPRPIILLKRPA